MRWFRFVVLVCLTTIIQASFLVNLNIKPDLLLILLVFFAIYQPPPVRNRVTGNPSQVSGAIITSFTIGFAADIIGSTMGPHIISYGIFGSTLAYLHRYIAIRKIPYQFLAVFVTGFLAGALAHVLTLLKGQPAAPHVISVLFGTSLFSALVGPFLFLPCVWWMRMGSQHASRHVHRRSRATEIHKMKIQHFSRERNR